ncbi:hypothetical protein [Peribacillus butanolivorans]|nr:hypothetical protein [Peribacillus butanolivorans]
MTCIKSDNEKAGFGTDKKPSNRLQSFESGNSLSSGIAHTIPFPLPPSLN